MQTTTSNPHELIGRMRKMLRLIAAIDRVARRAGCGEATAADVRALSPEAWLAYAREAGVIPPSDTTILAIIQHYEDRGAELRGVG